MLLLTELVHEHRAALLREAAAERRARDAHRGPARSVASGWRDRVVQASPALASAVPGALPRWLIRLGPGWRSAFR